MPQFSFLLPSNRHPPLPPPFISNIFKIYFFITLKKNRITFNYQMDHK